MKPTSTCQYLYLVLDHIATVNIVKGHREPLRKGHKENSGALRGHPFAHRGPLRKHGGPPEKEKLRGSLWPYPISSSASLQYTDPALFPLQYPLHYRYGNECPQRTLNQHNPLPACETPSHRPGKNIPGR